MPKWLLVVVVVVIGLGVAIWALRPDDVTKEGTEDVAAEKKTVKARVETLPDGTVRMSGGTPIEERAEGEEPAEVRPPNKAEIMLQARLSRPFNKHVDHVSSIWGVTTRALLPLDKELARETEEMSAYLLDMGRLNEGELVVDEALNNEMALVEKIRAKNLSDPNLPNYMSYIEQSVTAVRTGGDPTTIPRPVTIK